MKKIIIIICITVALFAACGSNSSEHSLSEIVTGSNTTIDISQSIDAASEYPKEELISEIKIIPLETKEEALVSYIDKIVTTANFIYLIGDNSLYIFDNNGQFLKKTPRGNGQEDIAVAECFYYDRNAERLYIYDVGNNKVMICSKEGNYKGCHYIENGMHFRDIAIHGNQYVLAQNGPSQHDRNFRIITADTLFSNLDSYILGFEPYDFGFNYFFQETEEGFNISKTIDNSIYVYDNGKIEKKYTFTDKRQNYKFEQYKDFSDMLLHISSSDYINIGRNFESKDILYTTNFLGGRKIMDILISKNNGCQYKLVSKSSLSKYIIVDGVSDYGSNCFWGQIMPEMLVEFWDGSNPNNLISPGDMEKLKAVTPDDNPIIVLFKLKDDI